MATPADKKFSGECGPSHR